MPPSDDAHPADRVAPGDPPPGQVGRHRLGAHAVGRRVVLRRLLRGEVGPTGGPAFTDLLGDLVAWPEDDAPPAEQCAVVLDADGGRTRVPLADIVSGKPVPPRASARQRVSAHAAERHALALWPWLEAEPLGDWVLRTDAEPVGRLVKRANSALAMGDPGLPPAEAAQRVVDFYAGRARTPLAQVEAGSDVHAALLEAGWNDLGRGASELWLGSLAMARRRLGSRPAAEPREQPRLEEDGDLLRVLVGSSDSPVASVRGAVDGDWLGLHDLAVAATRRRQGLGRLVLDALLERGAERGATTVWLHVELENEPARALYADLGLATHHGCRYLVAPGTTWSDDPPA